MPIRTAVYIQDACYQHQYIRSNDLSTIVERPERLRALNVGLSAAIARIELASASVPTKATGISNSEDDDIANALNKLDLTQDIQIKVVDIVKSKASLNLLDHRAVKYVHGDIDGDVYLGNLIKWGMESADKIKAEGTEIPDGLPQGDLYLCPQSVNAIRGALATVCEAVDDVMNGSLRTETNLPSPVRPNNAFVAIRPPGHHCGEDTPSGFCFVNNVVVAASHAHLQHGIEKVVIFDIDLHHGNGTQALVWQINEESYRKQLESESGAPNPEKGLQIFYGSLHDILSFPCEDGNPTLVQAASVRIHGPHGQFIENIHLQPYQSDADFWNNLYPSSYSKLFDRAKSFVSGTSSDKVLTFISCGFDACEHEYESMSRHGRRVPTSFYNRFAVDARGFAAQYSKDKLISVLEGGYSDRALISGGMAHLTGLVDLETQGLSVDESWWGIDNIVSLEKATKKKRGGKFSLPSQGSSPAWLERTVAIFQSIETPITPSPSRIPANTVPPSSMTLRERKPLSSAAATPLGATPRGSPKKSTGPRKMKPGSAGSAVVKVEHHAAPAAPHESSASVDAMAAQLEGLTLAKPGTVEASDGTEAKKLPKVILRLNNPPSTA